MATFCFAFQPNLLTIESDQPGVREALEGVYGTQSLVGLYFLEGTMEKAVAVRQEAFEGYQLAVIEHGGEEWFSVKDVAQALGYADRRKVHNLYYTYQDEFEGISTVLESGTVDGRNRKQRFFNLQGCQMIGFFARTPRGKLFRRWASNMLAHGVHKMRAGLEDANARLEDASEIHGWQKARIGQLEGRLGGLTRELNKARKQLETPLKALPAPEPPSVPAYHLETEKELEVVRVNWRDLRHLVEQGQVPGYDMGFLVRVLNAQDTPQEDLSQLFRGLEALPRILKHLHFVS